MSYYIVLLSHRTVTGSFLRRSTRANESYLTTRILHFWFNKKYVFYAVVVIIRKSNNFKYFVLMCFSANLSEATKLFVVKTQNIFLTSSFRYHIRTTQNMINMSPTKTIMFTHSTFYRFTFYLHCANNMMNISFHWHGSIGLDWLVV